MQQIGDLNLRRVAKRCFLSGVPKVRSFFIYWLPVVLWMAVAFTASGDTRSYQHSSRIIAPLLRWLFPHISQGTVDFIVLIARKCAHLTEYAIMAFLFWRALRKPRRHDPRPWSWREAVISIVCVAFYASTDEMHQFFVATRQASVHDVVIDTVGAAVGMILLWCYHVISRGRGGGSSRTSEATLANP